MSPAPSAPPAPGAGVEADAVGFVFPGGVRALEACTFSVPPGAFTALLGPSGCGKSTLLRLVAGLYRGNEGTLAVGGTDPLHARRGGAGLAFVFQSPTLLPWRSVEANVRLPLEVRGRLSPEARARIPEVLRLVGLEEFRRFLPHQLSGGMQMRVSLARALVTRPRLLLLDEPFASLDEMTRHALNEELIALWERDRCTALFVTHNVAEAVFLSERVLVMSGRPGTIRCEVPVEFPQPRNAELRGEPAFARLVAEIGRMLRSVRPS